MTGAGEGTTPTARVGSRTWTAVVVGPLVAALGLTAGAAALWLTADRAGDPTCGLIAAVPAFDPTGDVAGLELTARGWRAVAGGAAQREVRVAAAVVAERVAAVADGRDAPVDVARALVDDAELAAANDVLAVAWASCDGE